MQLAPHSYTGVTGVMNRKQSKQILANAPLLVPGRKIMIGLLASGKTIRRIPNKYPKSYPVIDDWGAILVEHPRALNLVHYSTDDTSTLVDDMIFAQTMAGPACHGFQLNMPYPSLRALESYKAIAAFSSKVVVLQCGTAALKEVDDSPIKLAESLKAYNGLIDYVLIDASGGFGKEFNPDMVMRYLDKLAGLTWLGLGFAGGLCAATIYKIEPIIREFPGRISFDAQGKLHDSNGDLDMDQTIRYLRDSNEIVSRFEGVAA